MAYGLRFTRTRLAAVLTAATAMVAACGGGLELILAAVVTPLNGAWRQDADINKEGLQFISDVNVHLFSNKYELRASIFNPSNRCGAPDDGNDLALLGTFEDGKVVLRARDAPGQPVCIEGNISTLIRFDAVATGTRPVRFYENTRVDVQMDLGIWANESGSTRLKFSDVTSVNNNTTGTPIRACDSSPGIATATLEGAMDGYQKATGKRPFIARLTPLGQTAARFTEVEFVDGATITLRNAAGATITLKRQREAVATVCPSPP